MAMRGLRNQSTQEIVVVQLFLEEFDWHVARRQRVIITSLPDLS